MKYLSNQHFPILLFLTSSVQQFHLRSNVPIHPSINSINVSAVSLFTSLKAKLWKSDGCTTSTNTACTNSLPRSKPYNSLALAIKLKYVFNSWVPPHPSCGNYSVDTKGKYVEILRFKLFHDYFAFEEDDQNNKRKVLKRYFNVSVGVDLVSGDTRQ